MARLGQNPTEEEPRFKFKKQHLHKLHSGRAAPPESALSKVGGAASAFRRDGL